MIKLHLTTSCEEHEILKAYLEENVSEILANKINNGVRIEKDGKTLINKKDLDGFMNYAQSEAKKIAEKGKNYKAVHHNTVFAWAIHYFEEDSIEGTLYNEDGTEYKTVKPQTKTTSTVVKKPTKTEKKTQNQFSLFDLMGENKPTAEEPVDDDENNVAEPIEEIDDDEPSEEEIQEAFKQIHEEEEKEKQKPKGTFVYQKFMEIQEKYPNCIVAYRLGDFYEIFGENAVKVSNELDLTLTGRDCGLQERIPMVGFPYHCADIYFDKIIKFATLAIAEAMNVNVRNQEVKSIERIDYETGELLDDLDFEEMAKFDGDIEEIPVCEESDPLLKTVNSLDKELMLKLYEILGDIMSVQ